MDLPTKPRNTHRHRCTGLTYLPSVGARGCLGSKTVWKILTRRGHMALPRPRASLSGSGGEARGCVFLQVWVKFWEGCWGLKELQLLRMISIYFGWGHRPSINQSLPTGAGCYSWKPDWVDGCESLLGSTGLFVGNMENQWCALRTPFCREAARVRYVIDTEPHCRHHHMRVHSQYQIPIYPVSQSQNTTQPTLTHACPRRFTVTKSYKQAYHHKVKT